MNINANNSNQLANLYAARQNKGANAAPKAPAAGAAPTDKAEFNVLQNLRSQPEIRPDVVAKGKELLKDPNFPSQEMINSIAKLITPYADEQ